MATDPLKYLEPAPPMPPRNAELEAVILENPDDKAGYLVYADWLTQQGDPRGELIIVQSNGNAAREAELFQAEAGRPLPFMRGIPRAATKWQQRGGSGVADATWRMGFWHRLRVFNVVDWMDSKFPVSDVVDRLFTNPAALVLRELEVGVIRWEYNGLDVKLLLDEAAKAPFAKTLTAIRLGEVDGIDIDCAHHPLGDLGAITGAAFPELRELKLWGCEFSFGTLDLPKLETLRVETCGLPRAEFEAILTGKLPSLAHLDIWFGSEDYGNDTTLDQFAPLFEGAGWPKLAHLGLMNCPFTDELVAPLAASKILRQLTELDFALGTLSDDGARTLLQHRDAFAHLKRLDVSRTYVSAALVAELRAIGPEIVANDLRDDEDPEYRYVAIGE